MLQSKFRVAPSTRTEAPLLVTSPFSLEDLLWTPNNSAVFWEWEYREIEDSATTSNDSAKAFAFMKSLHEVRTAGDPAPQRDRPFGLDRGSTQIILNGLRF
jgi:hypothetical protein